MKGFKLIGIRFLINCFKDYSKIFENGWVYIFYNDYKIIFEIIIDFLEIIKIV